MSSFKADTDRDRDRCSALRPVTGHRCDRSSGHPDPHTGYDLNAGVVQWSAEPADEREIPERCHQRLARTDFLSRGDFACTFLADHPGLHHGRQLRPETGEFVTGAEVIRWGSPFDLAAEFDLMTEATRGQA